MKKCLIFAVVLMITFLPSCGSKTKAENSGSEAPEVSVYMPGDETENEIKTEEVTGESEVSSAEETADSENGLYYANKNTKKFHLSTCHSAKIIKNENLYVTDSRDELINGGFVPCKNCNP